MPNKNVSFSAPYIHKPTLDEMDFTKLIDDLMDRKKGHHKVRKNVGLTPMYIYFNML